VAEQQRTVINVRQAAELTGAQPATIRAAVRRGHLELVGLGTMGGYGRRRLLLDAEEVLAWQRRSGRPLPLPADPIRLALDGSLKIALDRALAIEALRRAEAERQRLLQARRAVEAARRRLLLSRG
jgi:hypothetical protein